MYRHVFIVTLLALAALIGLAAWFDVRALWTLVVVGPIALLGVYDMLQREHTILRNFPVLGHFRYAFEAVRPEIQQYFIESNVDAFPVEREFRSIIYQRAKDELQTQPFGTQRDVQRIGYEWASHVMMPAPILDAPPRIRVGGPACSRPYDLSMLNISAMSFGSLSGPALRALNRGAARGGFAHNTGEGGVAPCHLEGGDLIWQVGTGYFGCRSEDGRFDPEKFRDQASDDRVKMVELKLSQGAKPGHGGILPAVKVTDEIAQIRGVTAHQTVFSPPAHSAFSTPTELVEFIERLRELSGGKPVGFKLCVGRRSDFFSVCKAMIELDATPDFITVDGGEGGTGAAPLEFSNSLGMPARDAWIFVHSTLRGAGLRDRVKLLASGKIMTGFHMARALAIGADACYSARGFMFALGCIQALRCNNDTCPTGITTQHPARTAGLHVGDKAERVFRFHRGTVRGFLELLSAMGLDHPDHLAPRHVFRRSDDQTVHNYAEQYDFLEPGQLIEAHRRGSRLEAEWDAARPDRWIEVEERGYC